MRKAGVRKCMLARGWHIHFLTPVFLITFVHPRVNALVVPSGVTSARLIAPPNLVLSLSVVRIRLLSESLCHNGAYKLSLATGPRGAGEASGRGGV